MLLTTSTSLIEARIAHRKQRVLIVDNLASVRTTMSQLLRDAGADVIVARDADEGMGHLLSRKFHVLMADIHLPVFKGIDLVRCAMALPDVRRPDRVIAISGEYKTGSLGGGPFAYMPKPHSLNMLLDMVAGKPN